MFIWFVLFFIVIFVSVVLAYQSMADYQEVPRNWGVTYSLFLIQKPQNLTPEIIKKLYIATLSRGLILSLERLFKGGRQALVIYGPSQVLIGLVGDLGLLELEDYSLKLPTDSTHLAAWEVGIKSSHNTPISLAGLFHTLPTLEDQEEFWWQLVLQPVKKDGKDSFQTKIRAVLIGRDSKRVKKLQEELIKLGKDQGLAMLPQAYSSLQVAKFYHHRSTPSVGILSLVSKEKSLFLDSSEVESLVALKS